LPLERGSFSVFRIGKSARISRLADGTAAVDAVNKHQLDGVQIQATATKQAADKASADVSALDS